MGDYDIWKIVSAVVTMLIILIPIRIYLGYLKSKRVDIQKPEWMEKKNKNDSEDDA